MFRFPKTLGKEEIGEGYRHNKNVHCIISFEISLSFEPPGPGYVTEYYNPGSNSLEDYLSWAWVTNINILLTMSKHHQEKR